MAAEVALAPIGAAAAPLFDGLTLHTGDPGAAGTDSQVGGGKKALTCAYAAGGQINAAADVDFDTNTGGSFTPTHYGLWDGTDFVISTPIPVGDQVAVPTNSYPHVASGARILTIAFAPAA